MGDQAKTATGKAQAAGKRYKALVPYSYRHGDEEKTGWTRVGTAFVSRDGEGINIELRPGISVHGRVVLRPFDAREAEQDDEARVVGSPKFHWNAGEDVETG